MHPSSVRAAQLSNSSVRPSLIPSTISTASTPSSSAYTGAPKKVLETPKNNENINVAELKRELDAANEKIAGLSQQLAQQQITQHTFNQALASPEPVTLQLRTNSEELLRRFSLSSDPTSANPSTAESAPAPQPFDAPSDPWSNAGIPMLPRAASGGSTWTHSAGWNGRSLHSWQSSNHVDDPSNGLPPPSRTNSGVSMPPGLSRGWAGHYAPSAVSTPNFSPPMTPFEHPQTPGMAHWHPRPGATSFAPTSMELTAPWNDLPPPYNQMSQPQYMQPNEPINYRRLLDRNVSCNWKYIVDKIICSNDQQASIFLQQKLKVSTAELKYELVDAIIDQAYPLMINRFGNFLIQRCLEHGSSEQVAAIATTIRGKTLDLSMDAFGCHVVQKALDVVPEAYKAAMVHELLRRIPETVVHRYSCHVWQKLFELRWTDSPPQIMRYVNDALHGMWHEVALGETGSLVVQNIFENCLDEDKRPCVTEVLQQLDLIAHGQFGNWCIQHICEHGAPMDKSRAIEHVISSATAYSTDQFASKVVEKCLKVGGVDFLDRYLAKVCEARPDRPRVPLIDIAGDQYGNYLVQYILLNSDAQHRESVAQEIRKHMVSLRGSKFGSRVALLCNNPSISTRPGPPAPYNDRFYNGFGGPMGRQPLPGSCR